MASTTLPITPDVERSVRLIGAALKRFPKATDGLLNESSSQVLWDCSALMILIIRHVESICALARRDLALLPSSVVIARAALETAARLIWVLFPGDDEGQEARWLTWMKSGLDEDERFLKRASLLSAELNVGDITSLKEQLELEKSDYETRKERLGFRDSPEKVLSQLPTMDRMLESLAARDASATAGIDPTQNQRAWYLASMVSIVHFVF